MTGPIRNETVSGPGANGAATVVIDTDEGTRLSGLPITIVAGAEPTTMVCRSGAGRSHSRSRRDRSRTWCCPLQNRRLAVAHPLGRGFRPSSAIAIARRAVAGGVDCHPLSRIRSALALRRMPTLVILQGMLSS
jgi:hypothetical protein